MNNDVTEVNNEDIDNENDVVFADDIEDEDGGMDNEAENEDIMIPDLTINDNDSFLINDCSEWSGFKIVKDNTDDRVDLGSLFESPPSGEIDECQLLPSDNDSQQLTDTFVTLISKILVTDINQFKLAAPTVTWLLPHQYSQEMKMKSEMVSLGIDLYNENKVDEMCKILERHCSYVPKLGRIRNLNYPVLSHTNTQIRHMDYCVWR
uniref:Uncharacterized protein n=1 Tax=Amphimedon queenslandica TaxID=400682 RepID=A0A1X7UDM3_AMPQE